MKKHFKSLLCVLSLIASGIALVVSLLRNSTWEVDYPSLLVSVLSVLVTALIGWNIYTIFDFNSRKKEMDVKIALLNEQMKSMQITHQMNKGIVEQAISDLYYVQLGVGHPIPMVYFYLNHLISAIITFTNAGDFETPRILIKGAAEVIVRPENVRLSKVERNGLLVGISLVKNTNKIPNWTDLVDIVARMGKR